MGYFFQLIDGARGASTRPRSRTLYARWCADEDRAWRHLLGADGSWPLPAFSMADAVAINRWNEVQRRWGLQARLRLDPWTGQPRLLEVLGPDRLVPHAIAYAAPEGNGALWLEGSNPDTRPRPCAGLVEALRLVETDL